MPVKARLLDLGAVSFLESQTIYHAVAYSMTERSPNTVTLMSPREPYVCIGFHQELAKEIDTEYCSRRGLPVLRREVGGGAVYLDGGQLFLHLIFHREDLPRRVEDVYRLFIDPVVATYRHFGIGARYRPLNDIVVGTRKIGGTGIASIGGAMVVAGSIMFDFDTESMARALRVSSEKMRDKVFESLRDYMTTMKRELGEPPPADDVKEVLLANLQRRLGIDLEPGELDRRERRMVGALNRRFQSPEWLHQKGGRKRAGIRIKEGLLVAEAEYKAPGGLIRVTARLKEGEIDDITISGDFTFEPAAFLTRLENGLRGSSLDEQKLEKLIGEFYRSGDVQAPGLEPEHLARAIARLGTTAEG